MMQSGPSSNPQIQSRNALRQLFTAGASRFGGIAPDDLPSFERAPSGIDWAAAAQGLTVLGQFSTVVENHVAHIPESDAARIRALLTNPRELLQKLSNAAKEHDAHVEALVPNILLLAARSIQEQPRPGCKEFGEALYQQATAIFQAAVQARLSALPGISYRLSFLPAEEPPRFPNN